MAFPMYMMRSARRMDRSIRAHMMPTARRWIAMGSSGDSGVSGAESANSNTARGANMLISILQKMNMKGASDLQDPFDLPRFLMGYLKPMNLLPQEFVISLLALAIEHNSSLPNVVPMQRGKDASGNRGSLTICGDTHGQFQDMCKIFNPSIAGFPSDLNRFIFNGDVTDRGPMGLEILLLLLAVQQCNPSALLLLRGNHECEIMNHNYGFRQEVEIKYGRDVYLLCRELFKYLPIASVLEDSVFIVHGGLGKKSHKFTIDMLNSNFNRFSSTSTGDILGELLWSDPMQGIEGFRNSPRGSCHVYGADITSSFLERNKLGLLIRSHEVEHSGYKLMHDNQSLTVFSAPNYCGRERNKGAVVRFPPEAVLRGTQVEGYEIVQFTEEREGAHTLLSSFRRLMTLSQQRA